MPLPFGFRDDGDGDGDGGRTDAQRVSGRYGRSFRKRVDGCAPANNEGTQATPEASPALHVLQPEALHYAFGVGLRGTPNTHRTLCANLQLHTRAAGVFMR